ncbi:NUDIX hydrolase [Listeria sp. PSOL-1]|uniref:NUDIX hydrolase n=1 Tax=Listeria sp. PSOL-1 TaxID=1844999 RepID=UPI0013CF759B|nr:NUDIX hydrolase [Listeria sp. PSOL-1]
MKRKISVEAFIYNEKKDEVLIIRKKDFTWKLPGGDVPMDKTMEDTLKLKIKQQTNMDIVINTLLFCKENRTAWEHVCRFVFQATAVGDFYDLSNDNSVYQVKWLPILTANNLIDLEDITLNKLIFIKGVLYKCNNELHVR